MNVPNISDEQWFEMILNPEGSEHVLGFPLPSFPPDSVQRGFTGKAGKDNLKQAFSFYQHIKNNYLRGSNPTIMDFGSGWGRIARFFLRDTEPKNLYAVDAFSSAVEWMKKTNLSCQIIHSKPLPPIPSINDKKFNLIYAFSVFSHLREEYFQAWIHYLLSLLDDDGVVVFTTRGIGFMNHVEKNMIQPDVFQDYSQLRKKYDNGEFQFFGHPGRDSSHELSGEFYGEALIPKQYLAGKLGANFLSFEEPIRYLDQAVVVLKRA